MYQTLILLGIVVLLAGLVGGGLKAFGVEIPVLDPKRVGGVLLAGAALLAAGILLRPAGAPAVSLVTTDPVGQVSAPSCPVNVTIDGSLTASGGQGALTVALHVSWDDGTSSVSPPVTVQVNGAGTYSFSDVWLFSYRPGGHAGDFEWEVVSPISDGSTPQPFSVPC